MITFCFFSICVKCLPYFKIMISKLRKDDKGKGRGSEALKYLLYYN